MGGWGSRVLNLWKCENTRYVTGKSRYFRYVSPKPLRWVGGVRYLGLFPKKNRFFFDPFPKLSVLICWDEVCAKKASSKWLLLSPLCWRRNGWVGIFPYLSFMAGFDFSRDQLPQVLWKTKKIGRIQLLYVGLTLSSDVSCFLWMRVILTNLH